MIGSREPRLDDDRSLALGDLVRIVTDVASGQQPLLEDLDGARLRFTVTSKYETFVALTAADVRTGGLRSQVFAARSSEYGEVGKATTAAVEVIRRASLTLTPRELAEAFEGGSKWVEADVVGGAASRTIAYDRRVVVFRAVDGLLERKLPELDEATAVSGWRLAAQKVLTLPSTLDHTPTTALLAFIGGFDDPNSTVRSLSTDKFQALKALLRAFEVDRLAGLQPSFVADPAAEEARLRVALARGGHTFNVVSPFAGASFRRGDARYRLPAGFDALASALAKPANRRPLPPVSVA